MEEGKKHEGTQSFPNVIDSVFQMVMSQAIRMDDEVARKEVELFSRLATENRGLKVRPDSVKLSKTQYNPLELRKTP